MELCKLFHKWGIWHFIRCPYIIPYQYRQCKRCHKRQIRRADVWF